MRQVIATTCIHVLLGVSVSTDKSHKVLEAGQVQLILHVLLPLSRHDFRIFQTSLLKNSQQLQSLDRQILKVLETDIAKRREDVEQAVVGQQAIQ